MNLTSIAEEWGDPVFQKSLTKFILIAVYLGISLMSSELDNGLKKRHMYLKSNEILFLALVVKELEH